MRFRSRIAALCALLAMSALLAVVATARAEVLATRLLPNGQAIAPPAARARPGVRLRHPSASSPRSRSPDPQRLRGLFLMSA